MSSVFRCELCQYISATEEELIDHAQNMHRDANFTGTCPFCGLSGVTQGQMSLHVALDHPDGFDTQCKKFHRDSSSNQLQSSSSERPIMLSMCPMCNRGDFIDVDELSQHVQTHFQTEADLSPIDISISDSIDSSHTQSGLMLVPRIRHLLVKNSKCLKDFVLCDPNLIFFGSISSDYGWGCGYRNLQMILSSVLSDPKYTLLFKRFESWPLSGNDTDKIVVPSIRQLQVLIEKAWENGFDIEGCHQLGGRLCDSKKWIGASEVVAFLSAIGIKTKLVDFVEPTGPFRSHPALMHWVDQYFTFDHASSIPPLFLQHMGHSRTIVGIEKKDSGDINLILFDPIHSVRQMEKFLFDCSSAVSGGLDKIRYGMNDFLEPQYQIVAVDGILIKPEEHKTIRSIRISK